MWEMTSPLPGGHYAAGASFVIGGEEMAHWKAFTTVFNYTTAKPGPEAAYAHHPWGLTMISALVFKLVGHSWVATRLPAVLLSAATPPLLYRVARALFGVVPSAVASIVFVLVPIDMAFSAFWNLEVPTIFFGLVFTLGTIRFWQTWKAWPMALSVAGALLVTHIDWDGAVLVAAFVGFAFVRAYVVPRRWFGRLDERKHARWFAFTVAVTVGTVLFYVALFSKLGRMQDLLDSYNNRTQGVDTPVWQVLRGRRLLWLYWMLTPIGLWAGGLGLLVALGRLTRKEPLAIVVPAWAAAAAFEYFVFKQGADTHIFWPHVASVGIALGAGTLADALYRARVRALDRTPPERLARARRSTAALVAVVIVLPLTLMARVAFPLLWQAHLTGGRFDEGGRSTDSERDKVVATAWAAALVPRASTVLLSSSVGYTTAVTYAANRPINFIDKPWDPAPKDVTEGTLLADARKLSASDLRLLAARYPVRAAGPFWRVDRSASATLPFVAVRVNERFPVGLERLRLATDLIATVVDEEDPWATWEWRVHLGQPATAPKAEPVTFDELRIAHNVAALRGDSAGAASLRARLEGMLTDKIAGDYTDDLHLVGLRLEPGPPQVMTLLWYAGTSYLPVDVQYVVRSRVTKRPLLWPTLVDPNEKLVSSPPALGPSLYRPLFLYAQRFTVQERLGTERFYGLFLSNAEGVAPPALVSGAPSTPIAAF
jgi:Dolichyl-phosphate-mannose-protein mannosyltransferase